jgi:hypothetical protein
MPARLIVEMVYTSVFWLNSFPNQNGISSEYSPHTFVVGQQIDYHNHCQLEFGAYVQTREDHDNSMISRTTGALALRPTGNVQGGYFFLSLTTGCRLNRYDWTALPMPQDVIDRVSILARRQLSNCGLIFTNRMGDIVPEPYDDDLDDSTYQQPSAGDSSSESDSSSDSTPDPDADSHDSSDSSFDTLQSSQDSDDNLSLNSANNSDISSITAPSGLTPEDDEIAGVGNNEEDNNEEDATDEDNEDEIEGVDDEDTTEDDNDVITGVPNMEADMDARYGPWLHDHQLRPRRPRNYEHMMAETANEKVLEETMMTQYSMKKGIEMFGEPGVSKCNTGRTTTTT